VSGGLVDSNFIYNIGGAGIWLGTYWNAYPTRNGTRVRNNIIVNCGGTSVFDRNLGLRVEGSAVGDNYSNIEINNNTIYKINSGAGLVGGVHISNYVTGASFRNNIISEPSAEAL